MPYIPSAPSGKAGDMAYTPASQIPPETGFGYRGVYSPLPQERDMSLERAREQHRRRIKPSPPMLGDDLVFRRCPSPKQTKLEPDHLWDVETGAAIDDQHRDPTEQHGLWRGYCYTNDSSENLAPAERPAMITTPLPTSPPPKEPFGPDYVGATAPISVGEELSPPSGITRDGTLSVPLANTGVVPEHRTKNHAPKGLHMLQNLHNLDEKLKKEKAAADREEKIAAEFDDRFVTQVFNYLSLGYPATARQYDWELGKISRMSVNELERDDEATMADLWDPPETNGVRGADGISDKGPKDKIKATGHIMIDSEAKDDVKEEDRCPRWKALKLYIYEWARQHPDLNAISPLAWGVQERRGSWGI
jgi:hypothetical protein